MKFTKTQREGLHIAVTLDTLTTEQIREARYRWPEWISSQMSANALGLPESHTAGGLPVYPPSSEIHYARNDIAKIISAHWNDKSDEHATEDSK